MSLNIVKYEKSHNISMSTNIYLQKLTRIN